MKLKSIANNQTEITFANGTQIFFSYETPVAAYDATSGEWIRTSTKFSSATSRHINKWLETIDANQVDQSRFERLILTCDKYAV
tara:strand:+ start:965 stop:1216 length:252 start_codon:yes stop_codon:yes gene_type:complete